MKALKRVSGEEHQRAPLKKDKFPIKDREALLKELKAGLGSGGTVKDTSLEIQGDHCDALIAALIKLGYRPKRSGG